MAIVVVQAKQGGSACTGSAFDEMTLAPGNGEISLVGAIRDQSHLYAVLDRVSVEAIAHDLRVVRAADRGGRPETPETPDGKR